MTRQRRQRSRDTGFHADREFANTVTCPARPHGCGAVIGSTCTNLHTGHELDNWPAHEARIRRAEAAEPATTTGEPA